MANGNSDQGFDDYRLKRQRRRMQSGTPLRPLGDSQDTLRQLEEAEAREAKDQQLSREVHEFFNSATKQAATIVARVAQTAKEEIGERLSTEMEDFLFDALQRMNSFVIQMLQRKQGQVAETNVETHMRNLLGPVLDGFRNAGTAAVPDKHLGQDPFATEPEAVRGELGSRLQATDANASEPDIVPAESRSPVKPAADLDEHPVAQLLRQDGNAAAPSLPATPPPVTRTTASVPPVKASAATAAVASPPNNEMERFKEALKNLVRQGLMTRDEARAAWQAKQQAGKT